MTTTFSTQCENKFASHTSYNIRKNHYKINWNYDLARLSHISSDLLSLKLKSNDYLSKLLNASRFWWPKSKTKISEGKQQLIIIELLTKYIAIINCFLFVLRHCKTRNLICSGSLFSIIIKHLRSMQILNLIARFFFAAGSWIFQLSINKPEIIYWPFRKQKARALWLDRV